MLHPPPGEIAERGQRETERRGEEMRWDREAEHEHSGEGEQRPVTGERVHPETASGTGFRETPVGPDLKPPPRLESLPPVRPRSSSAQN
jgi:hypothetical protein